MRANMFSQRRHKTSARSHQRKRQYGRCGLVIMLGTRSGGLPDVIIGGELPAPPASDE
jgi:hypothetical protein